MIAPLAPPSTFRLRDYPPRAMHPRAPRPGFTLVELLVVIAIISLLAALLLVAAGSALVGGKNTAIAMEMASISQAIEKYRTEKGDYPPSFGEGDYTVDTVWQQSVLGKHVRKAYPNASPDEIFMFRRLANHISASESLTFWLTLTRNDPKYPFFGAGFRTILVNRCGCSNTTPSTIIMFVGGLTDAEFLPLTRDTTDPPVGTKYTTSGTGPITNDTPYKSYGIAFKDSQLSDLVSANDLDDVPSLLASYCKGTPYIYIESQTYAMHLRGDNPALNLALPNTMTIPAYRPLVMPYEAIGEGDINSAADKVRPYFTDKQTPPVRFVSGFAEKTMANPSTNLVDYTPQNPTSFQLICAGQDGRFTNHAATSDGVAALDSLHVLKRLNSKRGINWSTTPHSDAGLIVGEVWVDDRDNICNFSEGKTLDSLQTSP